MIHTNTHFVGIQICEAFLEGSALLNINPMSTLWPTIFYFYESNLQKYLHMSIKNHVYDQTLLHSFKNNMKNLINKATSRTWVK